MQVNNINITNFTGFKPKSKTVEDACLSFIRDRLYFQNKTITRLTEEGSQFDIRYAIEENNDYFSTGEIKAYFSNEAYIEVKEERRNHENEYFYDITSFKLTVNSRKDKEEYDHLYRAFNSLRIDETYMDNLEDNEKIMYELLKYSESIEPVCSHLKPSDVGHLSMFALDTHVIIEKDITEYIDIYGYLAIAKRDDNIRLTVLCDRALYDAMDGELTITIGKNDENWINYLSSFPALRGCIYYLLGVSP